MSREDARKRYARIERLFHEALERPVELRDAFLRNAAGEDLELRREVESLLVAHESDGLVAAAHGEPTGQQAEAVPDRIGPYRVLGRLGEGGMGVVYLAEREGEGFTQTVALKLLRAGYLDDQLGQRFRSERAILARLEHPGIARLIDGGVTETGQPYYAMELVEGSNLLEYCDRRRLSIADRLKLFLEVCAPVRYAHQQLVVHRDLKPGNIMVTPDGRAVLLDFGVAKLLEPGNTSDRTRTSAWITPTYAAPEQVRGRPASTLSDVYALGMILYEMLAGRRPYDVESRSPVEIEKIICEDEPERLSAALASRTATDGSRRFASTTSEQISAARGTTPDRLRRRLSGDLDNIVLKALAKEPERRYGSVGELADDVRRHLDGRPVRARPSSLTYRASRFAHRHRTAVMAAALIGVTLVGGVLTTSWQARMAAAQRDRAELEADKVARVAGLMMDIFRLSDPHVTLGEAVTAREVLDEGTARVEAELVDQPDVQADLLAEVAVVYANLGILERAEALERRALEIRERLYGTESVEVSASLIRLGQILSRRAQTDEAVTVLRRGLDARARHLAVPDTLMASGQAALGALMQSRGEHVEAQRLWTSSLATRRAILGDEHPDVAQAVLGLASALHDDGLMAESELLFRRLLEEHPLSGDPHPLAAMAALQIGQFAQLREQWYEGDSLLAAAYRIRRELFPGDHPAVVEAARHYGLGLERLGRYAEAEAVLEESLGQAVRLFGERHPEATSIRIGLALIYERTGRYDEATAMHDTVVRHKTLRYGGDHPDLVLALVRAGEAPLAAGRLGEAERLFAAADSMRRRLDGGTGDAPGVAHLLTLSGMARVAHARGRTQEAEQLHQQAVSMAREVLRDDHRYSLRLRRDRARFWMELGKLTVARGELEAVLDSQLNTLREPHAFLGLTLADLGEAHARLGSGDAPSILRRALSNLSELPPDDERLRAVRALLAATAESK